MTDFSFHFAGALSFHFRWCWGWGTLYDTHAENSGKVAPGDPPPDPCLSLIQACLWKFEVGPLPDSVAAAPFATADIWNRRLRAAARRGTRGVHAVGGGHGHCHSPHRVAPARHPRRGVWAGAPLPRPLQVRLPLPTEFCLGFRGVCSPQVCLFFFKLQMQGKPPDIMRAGQTLTLKDSWAGLQVKSYA